MSEKSKEKVLAKWPSAYCSQHYDSEEPPAVVGYTIYNNGGIGIKLSVIQRTEYAAWDDAASRIEPESPKPQTESVLPPISDFAAMRMERDAAQRKINAGLRLARCSPPSVDGISIAIEDHREWARMIIAALTREG